MNRYKPVGWRKEPYRHYLAAKGISTRKYLRSKWKGVVQPMRMDESEKIERFGTSRLDLRFPRVGGYVESEELKRGLEYEKTGMRPEDVSFAEEAAQERYSGEPEPVNPELIEAYQGGYGFHRGTPPVLRKMFGADEDVIASAEREGALVKSQEESSREADQLGYQEYLRDSRREQESREKEEYENYLDSMIDDED